MATATRTWTFDSDLESWSGTPSGATVMQWQSGDGSPSPGCLEATLAGKNENPGASYWEIAGTWASLFSIPAGVSVTEVGTAPNNDYNWSCSEYTTGTGTNSVGPFELYDNTPTLQGTFSAEQGSVTSTTSWVTVDGSAISVPGAIQDSGTTIRLRLWVTLRTGNSNSAVVTMHQDTVAITITYSASTPALSWSTKGQQQPVSEKPEVVGY